METSPNRADALSYGVAIVHISDMEVANPTAPDASDIERIVHRTIAALPADFQGAAGDVAIRIEDFASDAMLADLEMDDAFALTGLYEGIPLTQKSISDQPLQPDTIWLFRGAILDEWIARGDIGLADLVAHVYIHELAHHFGWSDEDIASIDQWWT